MIRINLLPVREERKKESARQLVSIGILSIILLIVFIGYIHFMKIKKINKLNLDIKTIQVEISRLDKIVGDIKKFEKQKKELQEKIEIIDLLSRKKTGPIHMLDELTKTTPEKLWLTSLKEDNLKLTLDGIALDNETIAGFMRNLEGSANFSGIELIQSQQYIQAGIKLEKFNITCNVVLPNKE